MNRRARGFVECACLAFDGKDDHRKVRKATHILEQMPGLASHSIYTAAAADVAHARRLLQERPGRVSSPVGRATGSRCSMWVPIRTAPTSSRKTRPATHHSNVRRTKGRRSGSS